MARKGMRLPGLKIISVLDFPPCRNYGLRVMPIGQRKNLPKQKLTETKGGVSGHFDPPIKPVFLVHQRLYPQIVIKARRRGSNRSAQKCQENRGYRINLSIIGSSETKSPISRKKTSSHFIDEKNCSIEEDIFRFNAQKQVPFRYCIPVPNAKNGRTLKYKLRGDRFSFCAKLWNSRINGFQLDMFRVRQ